jgi:hypothetical protein
MQKKQFDQITTKPEIIGPDGTVFVPAGGSSQATNTTEDLQQIHNGGIAHHRYRCWTVLLFLTLVLSTAIPMRAASRVIGLVGSMFPQIGAQVGNPSWHTGRLWLVRLGYHKLMRPKPVASDWAWLCDHSVQIGKEKCLVVLGIRLSSLPPRGVALAYEDMEPLAILVVTESTGAIVVEQLKTLTEQTGVPRMIAADGGSDLHAGIRLFLESHAVTDYVYDMKHLTASILRGELKRDETWNEFTALAAKSSKELRQTEFAPLAPPNQRSKSRYMNLESLLNWATTTLALLRKHSVPYESLGFDRAEVLERLGWLRPFRSAIEQWHQAWQISDLSTKFIASHGYFEGVSKSLRGRLAGIATTALGKEVRTRVLDFVDEQERKVKPGERLLGSTEVLESLFGTFKRIEGNTKTGGFTQLALSIASSVGPTTADVIDEALSSVTCEDVRKWSEEMLGRTVHSKRTEVRSIT